jgi:uncharacterized protein
MARYFLDSSALVKRYHVETGTAELDQLFSPPVARFFISRLALVELYSCFARLTREGNITVDDFRLLTGKLDGDVASGVLKVATVGSRQLAAAASIIATHGLSHVIRSLDAIQLATASTLHDRKQLTSFVSSDKRLLAAAIACGLPTLELK